MPKAILRGKNLHTHLHIATYPFAVENVIFDRPMMSLKISNFENSLPHRMVDARVHIALDIFMIWMEELFALTISIF